MSWSVGRTGAKPTPQFPMTMEVTPCQLDELADERARLQESVKAMADREGELRRQVEQQGQGQGLQPQRPWPWPSSG